mmetsp:Transcript_20443/g.40477  ORF Transcript_20443/g.40477 Transcript_20443/m.40477 type:complete len:330 (-) Transcript_20443:110-1099(-)|eukprot:CAMPEP_0175148016 /NCGR_PEP_ID=MMETSP0087-20121206/16360_1 /TAXON_ID=136419 /ORGANISM="Unknown Unknown, Strain D1" /LENGTH=329 /DNA_ID=CAMNT_0016433363 /DNA_START=24 /DNA_END=1013 /DNA_ORIENTATION=-
MAKKKKVATTATKSKDPKSEPPQKLPSSGVGKGKRDGFAQPGMKCVKLFSECKDSSYKCTSSSSVPTVGLDTKEEEKNSEQSCYSEYYHHQQPKPTLISYHASPDISHYRDKLYCGVQLLPPESCRQLIKCADDFTDWCDAKDSVDRRAEWQHLILDRGKGREDPYLLPLCHRLAEDVVVPCLLEAFPSLQAPGAASCASGGRQSSKKTNLVMHWAFIRKYSPNERNNFPVHRDTSAATANILLSDPGDFTGGELYVLGNEHSTVDTLSPKEMKKVLPDETLRKRYAATYQQGQCLMHLGRRMHGVLPVTGGVRYTLIFMFLDQATLGK